MGNIYFFGIFRKNNGRCFMLIHLGNGLTSLTNYLNSRLKKCPDEVHL